MYRIEVGRRDADGVHPFEVECSSGTYVRTLAADIGAALGGGAHLRALRRTAIGSFTEADARPIDSRRRRRPARAGAALRDYAAVTVDRRRRRATSATARCSRRRSSARPAPARGPCSTRTGVLLAVYESHRDGTVKPAVVMAPA